MIRAHAILATALHTPARGVLECLPECLIEVGADGRIAALHARGTPEHAAAADRFAREGRLTRLGAGATLLPGLVDLHVHAPQFPQLGAALDVPLQDWLQAHTFPLEARYADLDFATEHYTRLVATLLANGTTTALYFATIHLPATRRLAEICLAAGQRALIGRVAMDNPDQCPPIYRDASAAIAEAETRAFITQVRAMTGNEAARVLPVITPRFIPACTDDLLHRLGRLAAQSGCHVQTHCSEGDWEHGYVQDRCGMSDAAALDFYGLLSRRTVLAHGVFVDDADLDRIKAAGAGIAHCPLSNAYFADAVFPLRHVLDRGVHVGLGTDIAGGASASMLDSARHALIAARHLENGVDPARPRATRGRPGARISAAEALWCATAGGGEALDLPIGMFRAGYHFDAIAIRPDPRGSNLAPHPDDCDGDRLQKILYAATRADIGQVWVGGEEVRKEGLLF